MFTMSQPTCGQSVNRVVWSIKKKKCWTRDSHEHHSSTSNPNMAAIGSLVFCESCGNLLDSANGDDSVVLTCDVCGAKCKGMLKKIHILIQHIYKSSETRWKNSTEVDRGLLWSKSNEWKCHADKNRPSFPRLSPCSTDSPQDDLHLPSHCPDLVRPAIGSL